MSNIYFRSKRRVLSFTSAIIIAAGIVYYLVSGNLGQKEILGQNEVVVVGVPDGDTLKIRFEGKTESVRLIGIDAPEIDQEEWGRKAQERLYALTPPGSVVILEFDVAKRDKYGRLLAYVLTKDGRLVNEILLREGLVVLYTVPPNIKYTERFREAQYFARENAIGIWGKNGLTMSPQEYRRSKKR
ncbi:MAG: thermonuclease family protein [Deltaproteobacteria bacterium]|nr:thermonuclease family protein [Deltaproteobacteria bacterium]